MRTSWVFGWCVELAFPAVAAAQCPATAIVGAETLAPRFPLALAGCSSPGPATAEPVSAEPMPAAQVAIRFPPRSRLPATVVAAPPRALTGTAGDPLVPALLAAGWANGVDPALLRAVIAVESGARADAVSPRGARGLMQLMPATARAAGVSDAAHLFDPEINIATGARHLRQLYDRFGSVPLALAAYNAGAGAVARHGRVPPYRETTEYVARVLARYRAAR